MQYGEAIFEDLMEHLCLRQPFTGLSPRSSGFDPRQIHLRVVGRFTDRVALGQCVLRIKLLPIMHHIHSFISDPVVLETGRNMK